MTELCDAGRTVLIETSGEADVSRVDPRVHKIMDLKAPGSGESHRNRWSNLEHITARDEIKFVLADRADYEWMRDADPRAGLDRAHAEPPREHRLRQARAEAARGLGPGGRAAGARAAPDAQVHLGRRDAGRLSEEGSKRGGRENRFRLLKGIE